MHTCAFLGAVPAFDLSPALSQAGAGPLACRQHRCRPSHPVQRRLWPRALREGFSPDAAIPGLIEATPETALEVLRSLAAQREAAILDAISAADAIRVKAATVIAERNGRLGSIVQSLLQAACLFLVAAGSPASSENRF